MQQQPGMYKQEIGGACCLVHHQRLTGSKRALRPVATSTSTPRAVARGSPPAWDRRVVMAPPSPSGSCWQQGTGHTTQSKRQQCQHHHNTLHCTLSQHLLACFGLTPWACKDTHMS